MWYIMLEIHVRGPQFDCRVEEGTLDDMFHALQNPDSRNSCPHSLPNTAASPAGFNANGLHIQASSCMNPRVCVPEEAYGAQKQHFLRVATPQRCVQLFNLCATLFSQVAEGQPAPSSANMSPCNAQTGQWHALLDWLALAGRTQQQQQIESAGFLNRKSFKVPGLRHMA